MEDELRCVVCKNLYNKPVLLPCYHSACLHCAIVLQQPATQGTQPQNCATQIQAVAQIHAPPPEAESVASGSSEGTEYQEADKLSILSETDSGVVCSSRPNSYVGTPNLNGFFPPLTNSVLSLSCPKCSKVVYFDENGANNLPRYRVMQTIIDKYGGEKNLVAQCQMCERQPANEATVCCDQCDVLYCDVCRETCHPARGPLAKHLLCEAPRGGPRGPGAKRREGRCPEHEEETLTMYCMVCKCAVCAICLHETRHNSHDVQAISSMCKAQKVRCLYILNTREDSSNPRESSE